MEGVQPYQEKDNHHGKRAAGRFMYLPSKGRIPQELVDQVLDCFRDEREALKACSLVCQDWLHRCRQHLHRSVTIYHQNCRIHPSQVPDVIRLLALPVVCAYTQELHLESKTDYGALLKTSDTDEDEDGEALFWKVLAQFAHIHILRVTRLFWVAHTLENKDRLCESFPCVTNLNVYMSDFVDSNEFLSFLDAFPRLSRLKMERVFWCESATEWFTTSGSYPASYRELPPPRTAGEQLCHLQVQHCDVRNMVDIAQWLSSIPSRTVTSLSLSPPDGDDFTALPLYFRAVDTSLEHLFLTLEFATKDETLRQAVAGLELCSRLRSLTLAANFGLGRKFVKAANIFWPCVLIVLDHVASTRLQTIKFECHTEDLESSALPKLDTLLQRPVFTHLSSVTFDLVDYPPADTQHVNDTLRVVLPHTFSRNLLVVLKL